METDFLLFDGDFCAPDRLAGEALHFALLEGDDTVLCRVNGEVAAHEGAIAGDLGAADLTDDDLAGIDLLAAKTLDAEALTGGVMYVLG